MELIYAAPVQSHDNTGRVCVWPMPSVSRVWLWARLWRLARMQVVCVWWRESLPIPGFCFVGTRDGLNAGLASDGPRVERREKVGPARVKLKEVEDHIEKMESGLAKD
eukprot:537736-Prymnesium_polylepis.1